MLKFPKKNLFLLPAVFLAVFLFYKYIHRNNWSLFVYPYGDTSQDTIKVINAYDSLEACKKGFEFNKKSFSKASFECGYKCKIQDSELGLYMCEKTID
jgi:hypothetical protein